MIDLSVYLPARTLSVCALMRMTGVFHKTRQTYS